MDSLLQEMTPLTYNEFLTKACGIRVWIKHEDMSDAYGSGNKTRKLHTIFEEIADKNITHLICDGNSRSNSCMALAHYASLYGYRAEIILYDVDKTDASYRAMIRSGATVHDIGKWSERGIATQAASICRDIVQQGGKPYVIPTGISTRATVLGQHKIVDEIVAQLAKHHISPTYIFCPVGSGGTFAAVYERIHMLQSRCIPVGMTVANDIRRCKSLVSQLLENSNLSNEDIVISDLSLGLGYEREIAMATKLVDEAAKTGLFLDTIYTGKAAYGMIQYCKKYIRDETGDIVFVHTGGHYQRFYR